MSAGLYVIAVMLQGSASRPVSYMMAVPEAQGFAPRPVSYMIAVPEAQGFASLRPGLTRVGPAALLEEVQMGGRD